jgi:hypothetical protein
VWGVSELLCSVLHKMHGQNSKAPFQGYLLAGFYQNVQEMQQGLCKFGNMVI